ncbi:1-acyl-sn-glycerol-3-phosphate acyltransferase [Kordiimonas sediminis]|uniref:1-acyl-sn-glycerol-3-phosphate acyltransferase n=1 Tax=Kordiimonas sediminis TaxID=1735581 RepID=A0A919ANB8_9PROT|nr:lysophospholipid acyltransferase family protein [Kordiimonas sediminis]GHF16253.1 1-acyl-sn-glycerol-3-phosphate acyltransferase [Kordiimonas sediminis]
MTLDTPQLDLEGKDAGLSQQVGGGGKASDTSAPEYGGLKSSLGGDGWTKLGMIRVAAIALFTLPMVFSQVVVLKVAPKKWWPLVGFWHRSICRIIGVDIREYGERKQEGPVLFVANHLSWLDIVILGGRLKGASFVAKSEVASWGALGALSKLHKTVFVNRERRTDSAKQRDALVDRIREGDSLILFPEGSNTDGMRIAPFKSALFSVAERANEASDHKLQVQPVTLAFTELNGIPLVRAQKSGVSWLGDVELMAHLRHVLGHGRIVATVEYHAPISADELGCRKAMASHCETTVRAGLERALRHDMTFGPRKPFIAIEE